MWRQNPLLKPWSQVPECAEGAHEQVVKVKWGHKGRGDPAAPTHVRTQHEDGSRCPACGGTSLAGTLILGIQSPELVEVSVTQSVEFRYGRPSWLTIWCLPLSIFLKWNLCIGEGTSTTWNFLRIVGFLLSFVSMSLFILNWMHKVFNESTIVFKLEAGNKKNKNLAKVLSSE